VAVLIAALAAPATVQELTDRVGTMPAEEVHCVLALMLRAGMLGEAGHIDDSPATQTWEFHDLLFHARSRRGRFDASYGGTYRFAGQLPPPPALKPATGLAHALFRPELERLEKNDPPLARVQSCRRSIRAFDSQQPITSQQLGEFLFRTARVTSYRETEVATLHGPVPLQLAARPYPAGGSLYELEVYAAIQRCTGLAAGLYRYDPAEHQLLLVCEQTTDVTALLQDAAASAAVPEDTLQVLFILAARFPRLAWKYESLAYALTLKHVGVLYQTMYLAATAMGLAPCALGGGDADLFARAARVDYCAETSVGEFLLGSPRVETNPASS
jgi:SagB-type dehydrogenase family enzyme